MGYPKKRQEVLVCRDAKSGGFLYESIECPDYELFTEQDWVDYNREIVKMGSSRLKRYLPWIVVAVSTACAIYLLR